MSKFNIGDKVKAPQFNLIEGEVVGVERVQSDPDWKDRPTAKEYLSKLDTYQYTIVPLTYVNEPSGEITSDGWVEPETLYEKFLTPTKGENDGGGQEQ